MEFVKTLVTGGKAIIGSIVVGIISWIIWAITAIILGVGSLELLNQRPVIMLVVGLVMLIVNIFILGFIYNKFWGWE